MATVNGLTPEERARVWITQSNLIPKSVNYDWEPFMTALVETVTDLNENLFPPDEDADPGSPKPDVYKEKKLAPSKDPSSGSWIYTWYIPEWTDPDYDEDVIVKLNGRKYANTARDAFYNLRPALLDRDALKNPTPYAQRFGVHPDESKGRSRTSPTFAPSRNPLDDYANQVNMLSDSQRAACEDMSKKLWAASGKTPDPAQAILPQVLSQVFSQFGALSNDELETELRNAVSNGMNLEQFVDHLTQTNPTAKTAHKNFLDSALRDQDWQRMIFSDMTTDELIEGNAHTMANGFSCDLTGEIHPFFRREKWEFSDWKGAERWTPRFVYNLNGTRQAWDVRGNDKVWDALQPALQLVTKILESNPAHLNALYNMNTRQDIDPERDPRDDPETASLMKYVMEDEIDLGLSDPRIQKLNDLGYDWKYHTVRILDRCLRMDIGSCYLLGHGADEYNEVKGSSMAYGFTNSTVCGADSYITISIAAEVIWPLLVDTYSQSEKLTCSFIIASTILHELAHAVLSAQQFLTEEDWAQESGQGPQVTTVVRSLADIWDYGFMDGEPTFRDGGYAELGFDFENSIWGFCVNNLTQNPSSNGFARFIESLPLVAMAIPWPTSRQSTSVGLKLSTYPIEDYCRPLPIEYMAKFFTQRFWDEDFQIYGPEALKQLPEGRLIKTIMTPQVISTKAAASLFGQDEWAFMRAVALLLSHSRHSILGNYLGALVMDATRRSSFMRRWCREIPNWRDAIINPLEKSVQELERLLFQSQKTHNDRYASETGRVRAHNAYVNSVAGEPIPPLDYDMWKLTTDYDWNQTFRVGGRLMNKLAETSRYMQEDVAFVQRMIFDYLNVNQGTRAILYRGGGGTESTPIGGAYARLVTFLAKAKSLADHVVKVAGIPQLAPIRDKWDPWRARFQESSKTYQELLWMIDQEYTIHPSDVSWKPQFRSLPSSYWKARNERLQALALREYNRCDPRIRKIVDDFYSVYDPTRTVSMQPTTQEVDGILDLMKNLKFDPKAPHAFQDKPIVFDFSLPTPPASPTKSSAVPPPPGGTTAGVPPAAPATPGGSAPGSRPRFLNATRLGATPPRRGSTTAGLLGRRGVGKTSASGRRSSAFKKYGAAGAGTNFLLAAQKAGAPGSFADAGISTSVINSALQQAGPGQSRGLSSTAQGAASVQFSQTLLTPAGPVRVPLAGGQRAIRPFPNPYSTRVTLTSDVAATTNSVRLARNSERTSTYVAPGTWRNPGGSPSSPGSIT
ncbi:Uu.00g054900.m01.CDS01 [Anthostomella pinea]|uniref:Uu.00g054900.m01.CDS01 n=1 Tax=Anthostomella pinea TaxID=933095 RepID=A0AAI8VXC6_9PEZI|nr:Uu.00g054900.m01.CDS01 [Anthostomella pinea]